jgi:hypothetical protein
MFIGHQQISTFSKVHKWHDRDLHFNVGGVTGAVYTYDSAANSLSDLHANRMPIRFSVQFHVRHQSTSICEIVFTNRQ